MPTTTDSVTASTSDNGSTNAKGDCTKPGKGEAYVEKCFEDWKGGIDTDDPKIGNRSGWSLPMFISIIVLGLIVLAAMVATFLCWWKQRRERHEAMTEDMRIRQALAEGDPEVGGEFIPQDDYMDELTIVPISNIDPADPTASPPSQRRAKPPPSRQPGQRARGKKAAAAAGRPKKKYVVSGGSGSTTNSKATETASTSSRAPVVRTLTAHSRPFHY